MKILPDVAIDVIEFVYTKRKKALEAKFGKEMKVTFMLKKGDWYIFIYDNKSRNALVDVARSFAKNAELNFALGDAVTMSLKMKAEAFDERRKFSGRLDGRLW